MLTNILLVVLVVAVALLMKQVRQLNRDVTTLFRLRSEEIERDDVNNLFDPADAAAHAVYRHVTEFHRRT